MANDSQRPLATPDSPLAPERITRLREAWDRLNAPDSTVDYQGALGTLVGSVPDLLAAIEGVRTFADRLIRMSGRHPEVITGDVVWTLRQILAGGPDLPDDVFEAIAEQVPGSADAEASTEAPPSPQPTFPDIWSAVARVLTGTDEPGVDSAFTVEDVTKAVWALLHPEVTHG